MRPKSRYDVIVIGGGPAGLAAAASARGHGANDVLVIERAERLGGILNQCIHNGFGLITYGEELTGPEYAHRAELAAREAGVEALLDTMVLSVGKDRTVTCVGPGGLSRCPPAPWSWPWAAASAPRERSPCPISRPAGALHRRLRAEARQHGRASPRTQVVILGSGIGLIMARRMTLEGAHVACVAELMPYSGGLKRNIVQCLDDFGIPLLLSHTVTRIEGRRRVEAVWLSEVGTDGRPVPGTEVRPTPCDTLLLSVGLLPENELSREAGVALSSVTRGPEVSQSLETSVSGVFACGNVLHVHDLVDCVTQEAEAAGTSAARFCHGQEKAFSSGGIVPVTPGRCRALRSAPEA